jgi:CheY-like chemotaxis protein/HPt (histidine-containing phosphotransfer) domain-containing protein
VVPAEATAWWADAPWLGAALVGASLWQSVRSFGRYTATDAATNAPSAARTGASAGDGARLLLVGTGIAARPDTLDAVRALGLPFETVPDGDAAIARAVAARFEAVLMDATMPGMGGIETAKAIRALVPADRRPRLIALTTTPDAGTHERLRAAGFDDSLTSPLMLNFLTRALAPRPGAAEAPAETPALAAPESAFVVRAQSAEVQQGNEAEAAEMLRALIRTHVTELVGEEDPEFVAELTTTFTTSTQDLLERVDAAIRESDLNGIRAAAHQLRGSASNVGLRVIGEAWGPVEEAARAGDTGAVQSALPTALHKTRHAVAYLTAVPV